jgi:hypothetical protein
MKYHSIHRALFYLRDTIPDILEAAGPGTVGDVEDFPSAKIDAVEKEGTFENLQSAINAVNSWFADIPEAAVMALMASNGHNIDEALGVIEVHDPVWTSIMPEYLLSDDGTVRPVPHMMPTPEGVERLHSIGHAALYRGVQASVFSNPVKSVDVYDGLQALKAGSVAGLEPVGQTSEYGITVLDGELQHPPKWPSDLMREISNTTEDNMEPEF